MSSKTTCERCGAPVGSVPSPPQREPRTLAELKADPRVTEVWREEDGAWDDYPMSYWVALAEGWRWEECITLHEPTVKRLLEALSMTYPDCPACR